MIHDIQETFAHGFSTQVEHFRLPGQVSIATNVMPDLVGGALRRPGTQFFHMVGSASGFSEPPTGQTFYLHPIRRDADTQYLVMHGWNSSSGEYIVRMFDTQASAVDNQEITVTIDSAAQTYLDLNSPTAAQVKMVTIVDSTYIVNTTVATGVLNTPNFTVTDSWATQEQLFRHTPTDDTYHYVEEDGTYWHYDVDGKTFATAQFPEVSGFTWASPTGEWDDAAVKAFVLQLERFVPSTTTGFTYTSATGVLTNAASGAFAGYEFRPGDYIEIVSGTGITTGFAEVVSKTDDDTLVIETGLTNGTGVEIASIGIRTEITYDAGPPTLDSMQDIAQALTDANSSGLNEILFEWVDTGVQRGYFVMTSPSRGSGASFALTAAPVTGSTEDMQQVGDPFDGTGWSVTDGTGTVDQDGSDADDRLAVEDRWTQVGMPNAADGSIDATKMPVRLYPSGGGYQISQVDWADRASGTPLTNPSPELFTKGTVPITDITYHRGRLVLTGDEYVVFSRVNDLYDFYLADPANVVDSDRIVAQLSGEEVAVIRNIHPIRQTLVLLTDAGRQFELTTTGPLTPDSVAFDPSTNHRTLDVDPVQVGSALYFMATSTGEAQLREYVYVESLITSTTNDESAHIRGTLSTDITRLTADGDTQTIITLESGEDHFYVYRTWWDGTSKIQRAWAKWDFDDTYDILDVATMDGFLWLLVEGGSAEYTIEKMPLAGEAVATGMPYEVFLDRRMTITGTDSGTNTIFDIAPLTASGSTINHIVMGAALATPGAEYASTGDSSETLAGSVNDTGTWTYSGANGNITVPDADGDLQGACYLGCRYTTTVRPTRPFNRDQRGKADLSTKFQLRRGHVEVAGGEIIVNTEYDSSNYTDHQTIFDPGEAVIETRTERFHGSVNFDTSYITLETSGARPAEIHWIDWSGTANRSIT
jgi:hypothetical protein